MRGWLIFFFTAWTMLYAQNVRVATAANMSFAFPALIERFSKTHPQAHIQMQVGGSGKLRAQIENGAPYDIFLSANTAYPEALYAKGLTLSKPVVYAKGALALLSVKGAPIESNLTVLTHPVYKKIAVANPVTAPYGVAAVEALKNAKVYDSVKSKLIYGESISQTVIYTLKAADGGLIAKSALFSPKLSRFKEGTDWIAVNPALYTPIAQGMVLLKHARGNRDAEAFFAFLQSDEAKEILRAYGYAM
jgi:molybdate transport system substrate-binding protein